MNEIEHFATLNDLFKGLQYSQFPNWINCLQLLQIHRGPSFSRIGFLLRRSSMSDTHSIPASLISDDVVWTDLVGVEINTICISNEVVSITVSTTWIS